MSNYQELLEYLEEMKQDGWILKYSNDFWFTFVKGNPKEYDYLFDVFEFDMFEISNYNSRKIFLQNYKEQGFKRLGKVEGMYIFGGKMREDVVSQPEIRGKIVRTLERVVFADKMFIVAFLILAFNIFNVFRMRHEYDMLVPKSIILIIFCILCFGIDAMMNLRNAKKVIKIYDNSLELQEKLPSTNRNNSIWFWAEIFFLLLYFIWKIVGWRF